MAGLVPRGVSPLTFWLAAFALFNIILVSALLIVLPAGGWREIAPYTTLRFFRYRAGDDSWHPIVEAWRYLQDQGADPVYQEIFFNRGIKFQYALTSLLPIELLALAQTGEGVSISWIKVLTWLSVWVTATFVTLIFFRAMEELRPDMLPRGLPERFALGAVVFLMTITFYPIAKAFTLGQIQTWINCLFAIAVWLWMTRRPVAAGLAGGLICAIKPQLGLLLLWSLLRRQWKFSLAFFGLFAAIALIPLVLYGVENNLDYLEVLSYLSRRGEAYYPNQSFNGLLNRLLDNGNNTDFMSRSFPPFHGVVYAGTLVTSAIIVLGALFWRRGDALPGSTLDLLLASLSFTIASPIAWEHHYGVLMPMFAVVLPALLRFPVLGRWSLPALALCYVLTSNFFNIAQKFAKYPVLTPVQSYLFLGALGLLAMLYLLRHAEASAANQGASQPVNSTAPGVPGSTTSYSA